jgi:hypothetical protein
MKKVFCTSFLLFATTLCFSAPAGKTDILSGNKSQGFDLKELFTTTTRDMPWPHPGCSVPPDQCPTGQ